MKINSIKTPISFQKRFMTTANVLNKGKVEECNIFELNCDEDKDYFKKVAEDKNWKNTIFLDTIEKFFLNDYFTEKTYTIENKQEDCLGIIDVDVYKDERIDINWIETCPKLAHNNILRRTKYVGKALVNFIINTAKENNIKKVSVPEIAETSHKFYKKYGFSFITNEGEDAVITAENYDDVLEKNSSYMKVKKKDEN